MKHDIGAEKKKLWLTVDYHWDSAMHGCYTTVWKAPCNLHPSNSLGDAGGDSNVTFINSWVMLNFFLVAWIWRSIDSLCDSEDFNGNETGSQILSQLVGLWRQAESLQTFSNPRKKQPGERNPTGGDTRERRCRGNVTDEPARTETTSLNTKTEAELAQREELVSSFCCAINFGMSTNWWSARENPVLLIAAAWVLLSPTCQTTWFW